MTKGIIYHSTNTIYLANAVVFFHSYCIRLKWTHESVQYSTVTVTNTITYYTFSFLKTLSGNDLEEESKNKIAILQSIMYLSVHIQ